MVLRYFELIKNTFHQSINFIHLSFVFVNNNRFLLLYLLWGLLIYSIAGEFTFILKSIVFLNLLILFISELTRFHDDIIFWGFLFCLLKLLFLNHWFYLIIFSCKICIFWFLISVFTIFDNLLVNIRHRNLRNDTFFITHI